MLDRRARAAFVVARLVHPDGTLQTSAGDLPTLGDALPLGRQLARRRAEADATSGFWWDGWDHNEERTIGHGAEACYLVRTAALRDIGLQDEGYVLDWEGLDWSERAWAAGWEVWFCPTAEAVHLGGVSIRQVPIRWVVESHRGMYRYFRSRRPSAVRPLLWLAFASWCRDKGGRRGRRHPAPRTGAPRGPFDLAGCDRGDLCAASAAARRGRSLCPVRLGPPSGRTAACVSATDPVGVTTDDVPGERDRSCELVFVAVPNTV